MRPAEYMERQIEVEGWPVRLTSYRLGDVFYCRADNVSPGATLTRSSAATRDQAEEQVLQRARQLLARTRRQEV